MPKSHSLLELSKSIESVLARSFNSSYWITAEISRLNFYPKSGHCYPELVEKQNGKIVAEIRSIIWRNTFQSLSIKFKNQTGEELKQGMKILFLGQVKYSPTHGISITINDIDPSFTMGEIAKEKKQSIEILKEEGVFHLNHNLPFPYFPQRLAIISVATSKGYHDFLETIKYKGARFNINISLFTAVLQGDNAINSITEQLEIIKDQISNFDLVLIIRGGGGDVGLHCYNSVIMARTVATFPIPVISGIGHSTNETVVEMVANTNKITPTAVADTLIEVFRDLENKLVNAHQLMHNVHDHKIAPQWQRLINVIRFLKSSSSEPLNSEKLRIQQLISDLHKSTQEKLTDEHANLTLKIGTKLDFLSQTKIKGAFNHIDHLESKLRILDPKNVLKRGFSMTLVDGKTVNTITQIHKGNTIKTVLFDGEIESKITKKINHE
jgi:exodeoxyribonuclease VII large subunit